MLWEYPETARSGCQGQLIDDNALRLAAVHLYEIDALVPRSGVDIELIARC